MIRTRKAKFYGHVRRHDSLQRVIFKGKVEGKRGRGRKRTSWTDNIKTHLGLPINTCAELALDRKKWRAMTPNIGMRRNLDDDLAQWVERATSGLGFDPGSGRALPTGWVAVSKM